MANIYSLAMHLDGYNINGWHVEKKLQNKPSTGGNFSYGYDVTNAVGTKGFLKALDYTGAFSSPNMPDQLHAMTEAYIFERTLLSKCTDKHLKYVVKIIDYGHFELSPEEYPESASYCPPIDYLVFERAEASVRTLIDLSQLFDVAWALRSLHNVAVGIEEMHSLQIAHQDVKPSNILLFKTQNVSKLGDVGRSSAFDMPADHDSLNCAGDLSYSPFEQLYGEVHPDWKVKRFSCDMYMFGNLIMTYFNNISLTTAVIGKLPKSCVPRKWGDTYRAILPQVEAAFAECVEEFNHSIDNELRLELVGMIKQLCNPNVSMRGDLKKANLGSQQYSLQRYISRLDYLATKYEYQFKKVVS